jgi:hypothetical protein
MCDYSLQHVASRPAAVGDKLVSTRFGESITRGFASPDQPNVAVCLLPGTEVTFERDVEFDDFHGNGRRLIAARVARFRQVEKHQRHAHHDALEFPSGDIVLLTQLVPGQKATVLQLPAQPRSEQEAKEQERVAVIA